MSENKKSNSRRGKKEGSRKRSSNASSGITSAKTGRSSSRKVIEEAVGKVSITREGNGFVVVPGRNDDIFVPQRKLRGALNNDTVRVAILKLQGETRRKTEGEIIDVVEKSTKPYIGILQIIGDQAWVIVENRSMPYDIKVSNKDLSMDAQGEKVAILVESWDRRDNIPVGRIIDILGAPGDNNTEMHAILAEFGLPYKFADGVEEAASKIPIEIEEKEIKARRDFRDILTITIDPVDAKDFDDAVSYRKLENGNVEIGVHIADVSHYVRPADIIDKEAIERGTSVYLVDRTVPMLPEVLSNNLCSLRPNEEKLTFSAVFEMNDKGKVINRWFGRTIINSCRRYAYEQVQQMIESNGASTLEYIDHKGKTVKDGDMNSLLDKRIIDIQAKKKRGFRFTDKEVCDAVIHLHSIADKLRKDRFSHGSISFERPEMKVIVDETGKPIDVVQKITKEANWLIEEYMLLANKEVATFVTKGLKIKEPTFVYRIHDEPDFDKIQNLRDFIKHFGYKMGPTPNAKAVANELNTLLDKIKGTPQCSAIEIIALRSMARAKYSTDNVGHYGLGFDFYTHFTSPIRRYPDLMVHRLLAHYLDKGKSENKAKYEELCKHSSNREQLATEAERSSIKYKLTEFMQNKVGNIYDGTVSGITEWGMYVEIEPTHVEGMIMLREVKEDYFIYDEKAYSLRGKSTGKKFTLGDKVKIRVAKVNLEQKLIDFELIWDNEWNNSKKQRGTKRKELEDKERPKNERSKRERPKREKSNKAVIKEEPIKKGIIKKDEVEDDGGKTPFYKAVISKAKKKLSKK